MKQKRNHCPACGAVMVAAKRGKKGIIYSCPLCSCKKISMGTAVVT